MAARTAELIGVDHLGIGSDLCQDQPDSVVEWMRTGRWTKEIDFGEGSKNRPGFPPQPSWFKNNLDHANIAPGLGKTGFSATEVAKIMGGNWLAFFDRSFGPLNPA
jgi:microsomal dipeptidase-like Zn-dependent dipeptidase